MSILKQKERIYLQFERLTDNTSDRNTNITHENNGFLASLLVMMMKMRMAMVRVNDGSTHAVSDIRICLCFVMYLYCICIFVFVNGESE